MTNDLRLTGGLGVQKAHEEVLELWVQMRFRLLDEEHPKRGRLLLRSGEGREQDRHVEQVVVAQTVLVHLQGCELSDLGPQGADDPVEPGIFKGERALLSETAAAGHRVESIRHVLACIGDDVDRLQRGVGQMRCVDDLLVIGAAFRRESLQERDEAVVAARSEVGSRVAKRMEINEAHGVARVSLDIGLLGIASEPLGADTASWPDFRLDPDLRRPRAVLRRQAGDHPGLLDRAQPAQAHFELELVTQPVAVPVVSEVVLGQPMPSARSGFGFEDRSQSVDDVALAGVVLSDQHRKRVAELDGGVEVAEADRPQGRDVHHRHATRVRGGVSSRPSRP